MKEAIDKALVDYKASEAAAAAEITHVGVKLPPFWPKRAELWFTQAEAQFVSKAPHTLLPFGFKAAVKNVIFSIFQKWLKTTSMAFYQCPMMYLGQFWLPTLGNFRLQLYFCLLLFSMYSPARMKNKAPFMY